MKTKKLTENEIRRLAAITHDCMVACPWPLKAEEMRVLMRKASDAWKKKHVRKTQAYLQEAMEIAVACK